MSTENKRALVVRSTDSDAFTIAAAPHFHEEESRVLALATTITAVSDAPTQERAIAMVREGDTFLRFLEKSRTEVKAPFLKAEKDIDAKAKELKVKVETETTRVRRLISDFQIAEQRRVAAELAEQERKIREQNVEIERLERQRIAAEQAAAAAKGKKAKAEAAAEAERIEAERIEKEIELSMQPAPSVVAPPPVAGATAKVKFIVEVTDIAALYRAFPQCVKMEPKLTEINNLIALGMRQIPGVKLTQDIAIQTRTTAPKEHLHLY